jgi:FdhE protein
VALDHLLASSYLTSSKVETLLGDLVADSDASIQRLADATSTDPDILAFVLRTVLSPFFKKQAAPYQEWVETAAWRRGVCPMCGSEPWMARLTHQEGRRILACSLCHTEWTFDRLRCPFCESDGQPLLRYFTVDDDEAHRVDCCDRCQRYVKTVDERVSGRPANLPVEDVITAHLDALARELGYQ